MENNKVSKAQKSKSIANANFVSAFLILIGFFATVIALSNVRIDNSQIKDLQSLILAGFGFILVVIGLVLLAIIGMFKEKFKRN